MGAVVVSNQVQGVVGAYRTVEADVTFSSSYATGGDSLALGGLGLKQIDDLHLLGYKSKLPSHTGGVIPTPVGLQFQLAGTLAAPLLTAYLNGSQVTSTTNLSTLGAVRVEFRGH